MGGEHNRESGPPERKSGMGMKFKTSMRWESELKVNLVFNEFLSNEYKRSFVEFHFPLCKLIEQEEYIGGLSTKGLVGKTCPYSPMEYHLMNLTVPTPKVKFVWPFTRARMDIYLQTKPYNNTIATGFIFVTIN